MTAKIRKKNSKNLNVIMKQSSLILILIICFLKIAYGSDHQLKKRSNQDVKSILDQTISYKIDEVFSKLQLAKDKVERDTMFSNVKKLTQGWAITIGSWNDILSNIVSNGKTLATMTDADFRTYGFLFNYGIGFGFPLLLGIPEARQDCGPVEFNDLLYKYGVHDLKGLAYQGITGNRLTMRINEFDTFSQLKLNCLFGRDDDYIEASEASWAYQELLQAINLRASLE